MKMFNKTTLFLGVLFLISIFFIDKVSAVDHNFPRRANYFLNWDISNSEAEELAKWDLLILDMEVQNKSEKELKKIRRINPDIVLLAYITPQEIKSDASQCSSVLRRQLVAGIEENWYLKDSQGKNLNWWPGTYLLNIANSDFQDYLVGFVIEELLDTGLWDGIFYDNTWDSITHFVGSDIDLDSNGIADNNLDFKWKTGMKNIYNQTRTLTSEDIIIVGNGTTAEYTNELNGKMLENFSSGSWENTMNRYKNNFLGLQKDKVNLINANTVNSGKQDYKDMRFGLGSALMEDGYYSYDYGDTNHAQTWWYDEYEVDLGEAIGKAESQKDHDTYKPDVWQRDFSNGLALVNSTAQTKTVSLGSDYEKIHGSQDPEVNDGSIIDETVIDGYDGLILLKTLASLNEVVFRNGDFVRFFNAQGDRVRNGFFVFEEGYKGGDKVAHIDLDGNDQRDLVVVHDNRIMAWRDDGQIFMKVYPYTASYRGELRVAIGDLNADGYKEIYVAPSAGYPGALKVYTRHGRKMRRDRYPFGESYTGGFYLGTGNVDGDIRDKDELLIGAGIKTQPKVQIYNFSLDKIDEWLAWEYWFSGGVPLTGGDVDGDGVDEIIVGAGPGKKPIVKILNKTGEQLYNEIQVYSSFNTLGVEVISVDVDFDGRDDIVGMSEGF